MGSTNLKRYKALVFFMFCICQTYPDKVFVTEDLSFALEKQSVFKINTVTDTVTCLKVTASLYISLIKEYYIVKREI